MRETKWIRRSTPFPNILIDQMMPRLRDTEWRVLTTITRATLGWVDLLSGQRKKRETLTIHQLRRRTGRESAAISEALDNLSKAGIILITDNQGRTMNSRAARRRARARLWYGLHPDLLARL